MRAAAPFLASSPFVLAVASLVLATACSSEPVDLGPEPGPPQAEVSGPTPVFSADPLAFAPEAVPGVTDGQDPSAPPVFFSEDPLAGAPMAALEGFEPGASVMRESNAPAESEFDGDLIERNSELALAVLRARFLAEEMGRTSEVLIPEGPFTFGELVPVRFRLRNPMGETVELLPPPEGLALVLTWEAERWLPIGGHDVLQRTRWYRLADYVRLESDETYETRTEIPLEIDGDPGALWRVRVSARLHCGGALLGDRQLPVHRVDYRGSSLHAFPPGWRELTVEPLAALQKVLGSADRAADRHVLIATALLRGEDRYRGLNELLDCLEQPASRERALTAVSALQWLTRLPLGDLPENWIRWRHDSTVASAPR
ncbi:MAG: hypothetical protein O3A20_10225 [Planctomycetota bacterium]|nr:hypothetical protein [Planctomycetota bacterium]